MYTMSTTDYELDSLSLDFTEEFKFEHLQMSMICTVNLKRHNEGFQSDTVSGVMSLVQNSTAFCNLTKKNVTIYKSECRSVDMCSKVLP